jgi:hypothetical protein
VVNAHNLCCFYIDICDRRYLWHFILFLTLLYLYHWQWRFLLISWVFELKKNGSLLLKWWFTNRSLISLVSKRWKLDHLIVDQIHLSYTFTVKGQEASQPSSLFNSVSSTRVIIVGIQFLFFESLPTSQRLTPIYLTGPQRSNCHVVDILALAFCPFGSSSKTALCFKAVSIQHANFNQSSYWRQENEKLFLKLVKIIYSLVTWFEAADISAL